MPGRTQSTGRGGGRGGRGFGRQGRGQNRNSKGTKTSSKKDKKFHPLKHGKSPDYSFDEVKRQLVDSTSTKKMDYIDDILSSVRSMVLFDVESLRPTLEMADDEDPVVREEENSRLRTEYSINSKRWSSRETAFRDNKRTMYGIIMNTCTEEMKEKLQREADFDTTLYGDFIELLKRIQKFMTTSEDTEWDFFNLWEAMGKLTSCRQKNDEALSVYRRRFEENAKGVRALLGESFLDDFAEETAGFDQETTQAGRTRYRAAAWEMLLASGLIYNADRAKYQSRIDAWNAQYALTHIPFVNRRLYPLTVENAAQVLNQHKHDNRKKKQNEKKNNGSRGTGNGNGGNANQNNENQDRQVDANLAQSADRTCFCCGARDHIAPNCPHRDRPREQWVRPDKYRDYTTMGSTQQAHMQQGAGNGGASTNEDSSQAGSRSSRSAPVGWSYMQWRQPDIVKGLHFNSVGKGSDEEASVTSFQLPAKDARDFCLSQMKERVHLDSGSTFDLAAGKGSYLVEKGSVRRLSEPFSYMANSGSADIHIEGRDAIFGGEWWTKVQESAYTNIKSLSLFVKRGYTVYMDSDLENSIYVVNKEKSKVWRFREKDGLYALVEESVQLAASHYRRLRGMVDDQADLALVRRQKKLQGMIDILEEEKRRLGTRADHLRQLWKWAHYERFECDYGLKKGWSLLEVNNMGLRPHIKAIEEGLKTISTDVHGQVDMFEWKTDSDSESDLEVEVDGEQTYDMEVDAVDGPTVEEVENSNKSSDKFSGYCGLQSVEKNKEGYTKRQVEGALAARSGYYMVGAPDMNKFKLAVRAGMFKNCPLTESDIVVADKIYGPSVSALKGKNKRPTPRRVVDDWIEIPKELLDMNRKIDLCVDIMFINNVVIFTSIDTAVRYRMCVILRNRTKEALYEAIDKVLREYNHAQFTIKTIYCDGEFKPVFDPVKDDMEVHMNYATPGEHEPTAERNNQTLKGLFRTQYHRMVYKAIPRIMTEELAIRVAQTANYFPAKGGISKYYSPHMIIKRRPVDYSKECVAEFGAYVQGYGHETRSNQATRTIDAIYLGPSDNFQEGHKLLDLNTRKRVTRPRIKVVPITKQVISIVEAMAAEEGVRDLKTYHWKNGEVILDGDLLAGVDPDELWDEAYVPNGNEYNQSDENLRNEYIPTEEVDALLEEAADDIVTREAHEYRKDHDNESVGSLYERLQNRRARRTAQNPNPSDQEDQEESDDDLDDHEESEVDNEQADPIEDEETKADEAIDELVEELVQLERDVQRDNDEESVYFDELQESVDIEEDSTATDNDGEEESVANEEDETIDTSEYGESEEEKSQEEDRVPSRAHRSGKSYLQNGVKMRPSMRPGTKKLKYQAYLQKNKKKPNSLKNRSAMRKKARKQILQKMLVQKVVHKRQERRSKSAREFAKDKEIRHNLMFQQVGQDRRTDYSAERARLIAQTMQQIKDRVNSFDGVSFIQQYYITKGLKVFGDKGHEAAMKELDQLVKRNCWSPIDVAAMTPQEKKRAVDAMMLLAQKNDGTIKGRCVFKGNETRDWLSREDTASPTASHEGICATCVIDAKEERDVMSVDIPNAFIQTLMPTPEAGADRVIMKITGLLVDYMIQLDPEYRKYVVYENGKRVIYVVILRAIYGMLEASLLWYKKLRGDLEAYGFEFNPYDPCIANKMVNGKQHTIRFHVDDLLSSHVDPKVNDQFHRWMNETYGNLKEVTCTRGDVHTYLGMTIDFSKKGKVKIRMDDYVERMLEEFPVKFNEDDKQETPAGANLLEVGKGAELDEKRREIFHSFVAKALFLSKRARLDIGPTVAILASRVQKPIQSDWKKLVRMMRYLSTTKKWHLTLTADDLRVIKWYIDASFAVHPDFKSHTGAVMTMGDGAMQVMSRKQKLNSRSSTEAELIGVDDAITQVLWTKLFMEAQGYPIEKNILYQDNKSSILLETNGRSSAGKRSRALNIRYFFVTDQVELGNVTVEYMPTDEMWADYMTKPLQGEKFRKFRSLILGDQD